MVTALEYAQSHQESFLAQLEEFVRIPGVSTDPARAGDIRRAAEWLADNMRQAGLNHVEVAPTDGHPVVYGEWLGAGNNAPTVLIYAHYDVQPAAKEDGWDSDPFEPYRKNGRLYGRGTADDKSHSLLVVKAAQCYFASGEPCPINVKYLIEGEEEIGSPHLAEYIRANVDKLKADYCFVADGGMEKANQPDIFYGLRGLLGMDMTVRGPRMDLHSGLHGGHVHNPAQAVAEIVAQLHREDGSVAVPGFYDDVRVLSAEERAELNKSNITRAEWESLVGAPEPWGENDYTLLERVTVRPTLEINGIGSGYTGAGIKTLIPAQATAKISCRLVTDQKPERIAALITDYVQKIAPPTVKLDIRVIAQANPVTVPLDSPPVQALARAFKHHWSAAPLYKRSGGTIPVVSVFQDELKLPCVMLGFALMDAGVHGPNEHYEIDLFNKGLDTLIVLFKEISTYSAG